MLSSAVADPAFLHRNATPPRFLSSLLFAPLFALVGAFVMPIICDIRERITRDRLSDRAPLPGPLAEMIY
jgi:hypothetical protein